MAEEKTVGETFSEVKEFNDASGEDGIKILKDVASKVRNPSKDAKEIKFEIRLAGSNYWKLVLLLMSLKSEAPLFKILNEVFNAGLSSTADMLIKHHRPKKPSAAIMNEVLDVVLNKIIEDIKKMPGDNPPSDRFKERS